MAPLERFGQHLGHPRPAAVPVCVARGRSQCFHLLPPEETAPLRCVPVRGFAPAGSSKIDDGDSVGHSRRHRAGLGQQVGVIVNEQKTRGGQDLAHARRREMSVGSDLDLGQAWRSGQSGTDVMQDGDLVVSAKLFHSAAVRLKQSVADRRKSENGGFVRPVLDEEDFVRLPYAGRRRQDMRLT